MALHKKFHSLPFSSMCLSVPWHYWIAHEYVSKLTTLHTHTLTSHIQFISINRACFSCIFYAFYQAFQSNIYHTHVATREDLCQPHKLIKLDRKREREVNVKVNQLHENFYGLLNECQTSRGTQTNEEHGVQINAK